MCARRQTRVPETRRDPISFLRVIQLPTPIESTPIGSLYRNTLEHLEGSFGANSIFFPGWWHNSRAKPHLDAFNG